MTAGFMDEITEEDLQQVISHLVVGAENQLLRMVELYENGDAERMQKVSRSAELA